MLEAWWVGKTPEECHKMTTGEEAYTVYFTMTGSVTVYARDKEEAEEKLKSDFSHSELAGYVDEVEVDDID